MNKPTRNLTLMTDLYELTMMNGYHALGTANRTAVFDVFFRQAGQISYAVAAGLEQAVEYIERTFTSTRTTSSICARRVSAGASSRSSATSVSRATFFPFPRVR